MTIKDYANSMVSDILITVKRSQLNTYIFKKSGYKILNNDEAIEYICSQLKTEKIMEHYHISYTNIGILIYKKNIKINDLSLNDEVNMISISI